MIEITRDEASGVVAARAVGVVTKEEYDEPSYRSSSAAALRGLRGGQRPRRARVMSRMAPRFGASPTTISTSRWRGGGTGALVRAGRRSVNVDRVPDGAVVVVVDRSTAGRRALHWATAEARRTAVRRPATGRRTGRGKSSTHALSPWTIIYPQVEVERVVEQEQATALLLDLSTRAQLLVLGRSSRGALLGLVVGSPRGRSARRGALPALGRPRRRSAAEHVVADRVVAPKPCGRLRTSTCSTAPAGAQSRPPRGDGPYWAYRGWPSLDGCEPGCSSATPPLRDPPPRSPRASPRSSGPLAATWPVDPPPARISISLAPTRSSWAARCTTWRGCRVASRCCRASRRAVFRSGASASDRWSREER